MHKYYTSLRLPLVAGNTYRFSFTTRVQYAGRRKALLAIHTSAERSGSTLLHDFDTLTATEGYQTYSHDFAVETTGSYHLIYYGESVSAPKNCYWYTDEVAVTLVNTPPTSCTLSSPANNSYYNPGQSVALVALPTDAQNNLSKVEWYSGATKVAEDATADAASILPTQSLGTQYRVHCYYGLSGFGTLNSEFLIVATQDGTQIEITPSSATLGGQPAGGPCRARRSPGKVHRTGRPLPAPLPAAPE